MRADRIRGAASLLALVGNVVASASESFRLRLATPGISGTCTDEEGGPSCLDGKLLGALNGTIGVYNDEPPVEWRAVGSTRRGLYKLLATDHGVTTDNVIALEDLTEGGGGGLRRFVVVPRPGMDSSADDADAAELAWTGWDLLGFSSAPGRSEDVEDAEESTEDDDLEADRDDEDPPPRLEYAEPDADGSRAAGWIAFPRGTHGEWEINWSSGDVVVPTIYIPVEIEWEPVPSDRRRLA